MAGFIYSFCAGASFQWLVSPYTYHDPPILAKKIGSHLTYNVIVVFVLLPFAYNIMQFLSNTIVLLYTLMAVVVFLSHHDAVYYRPQGPKLFGVLFVKSLSNGQMVRVSVFSIFMKTTTSFKSIHSMNE